MAQVHLKDVNVAELDVRLQRDMFMKTMLSELSDWLPDLRDLDSTSGFIGIIGQNIGYFISDSYKQALKVSQLNRAQIYSVLENIMPRIQRDFYVLETTANKLVFANSAAPFGDKAIDNPSLCLLISNILGTVGAENTGYAKVELRETINQGDPGCCVVVYLDMTNEAQIAEGREYYKAVA